MDEPDQDFGDFVAAHWARFVKVAVLMGAADSEAPDLVQDTFIKCQRSWAKLSNARDPQAYATTILVNTVRDWHRAARRRREVPIAMAVGMMNHDTVDSDLVALDSALAALPTGQRQVLVLRFYLKYTEVETGSILGISGGTVKSRTSRAMARLKADPEIQRIQRSATP